MIQNLKTMLGGAEHEYAELEQMEETAQRLGVVVDRLEAYTDADRVVRAVREGNVVFAKIGQFKSTNIDELKRTLGKIKTVCRAIDGEIVSVGSNEWIIVSPPSCEIVR